jgi:predicted HicB family RNase H-like nuclease
MLQDEKNQKLLSVRVPQEVKHRAELAAFADHRSLSNWLRLILEQRYSQQKAEAA